MCVVDDDVDVVDDDDDVVVVVANYVVGMKNGFYIDSI